MRFFDCANRRSINSSAASSVDEFFLNPYCCALKRLLDEKSYLITVSKTFDTTGKTEIGLYFVMIFLASYL